MNKRLRNMLVGAGTLGAMAIVAVSNVSAAAYDYASSTGVIDDSTSGLETALFSKVGLIVGISLGVWLIFYIIRKLKQVVR